MKRHSFLILALMTSLAAVAAVAQQPKEAADPPTAPDPNAPRYLLGHKDAVTATAFLPGGKLFLSASLDGTIRTWSVETGKETRATTIQGAQFVSMALSADGKSLAVGSADGSVRLLDPLTGAQIAAYSMGIKSPDLPLAFSPDSKALAAGCIKGDVKVWTLATGKEAAAFEAPIGNPVLSLAWSPDGAKLVGGVPDTVAPIWDIKAAKEAGQIKSDKDWIYPVVFTQDGKKIVSGSGKKALYVWDVASGQATELGQTATNVRQLKLSADGKLVIATSVGRVTVLDLATKKVVFEGDGSAASLSPDGKWVVSADAEDLKIQPLKPAAATAPPK
ncbi:MAG: WD40 repeat domain-containing protein [Armatimonadetes bacterium]|nr:WD40 repeat domain-containing protein [Armatimonadota bacterium]